MNVSERQANIFTLTHGFMERRSCSPLRPAWGHETEEEIIGGKVESMETAKLPAELKSLLETTGEQTN